MIKFWRIHSWSLSKNWMCPYLIFGLSRLSFHTSKFLVSLLCICSFCFLFIKKTEARERLPACTTACVPIQQHLHSCGAFIPVSRVNCFTLTHHASCTSFSGLPLYSVIILSPQCYQLITWIASWAHKHHKKHLYTLNSTSLHGPILCRLNFSKHWVL